MQGTWQEMFALRNMAQVDELARRPCSVVVSAAKQQERVL